MAADAVEAGTPMAWFVRLNAQTAPFRNILVTRTRFCGEFLDKVTDSARPDAATKVRTIFESS